MHNKKQEDLLNLAQNVISKCGSRFDPFDYANFMRESARSRGENDKVNEWNAIGELLKMLRVNSYNFQVISSKSTDKLTAQNFSDGAITSASPDTTKVPD